MPLPAPGAQVVVKIVKVHDGAAIYNEDQSIMFTGPVDPGVLETLGTESKVYRFAHLNEAKILVLDGPAPEQEW